MQTNEGMYKLHALPSYLTAEQKRLAKLCKPGNELDTWVDLCRGYNDFVAGRGGVENYSSALYHSMRNQLLAREKPSTKVSTETNQTAT